MCALPVLHLLPDLSGTVSTDQTNQTIDLGICRSIKTPADLEAYNKHSKILSRTGSDTKEERTSVQV